MRGTVIVSGCPLPDGGHRTASWAGSPIVADPRGPLRGVVGAGRITVVIDRTCMLDRAGEAPGYVLTSRARARVVVTVGDATT
jgi:hypothetical protein